MIQKKKVVPENVIKQKSAAKQHVNLRLLWFSINLLYFIPHSTKLDIIL